MGAMMRRQRLPMRMMITKTKQRQERICRRKKKWIHRRLVRLLGNINRVTCNKRGDIDAIITIEIIKIIIIAADRNNRNNNKVMDMEAEIDGSANKEKTFLYI